MTKSAVESEPRGGVGAVAFGDLVRRVGTAARAAGLAVPAFRSPPRVPGAARSIRRLPGGAVVSVRIGARSESAVAVDLVDGVIAANRLEERAAARMRAALLRAVDEIEPGDDAAGGVASYRDVRAVAEQRPARVA